MAARKHYDICADWGYTPDDGRIKYVKPPTPRIPHGDPSIIGEVLFPKLIDNNISPVRRLYDGRVIENTRVSDLEAASVIINGRSPRSMGMLD